MRFGQSAADADIDGIRIPRDRPDMGPYQHVMQS